MFEDWDAKTYDRVADVQTRWGLVVLDRLPLVGSERVLDAGCGTGRVTEHLLGRLPRGRVVALDASEAMLAEARRRLGDGGRVEYLRADLGRPLPVDGPVDAVLSTATFHWVLDHDALFAHLAAVLRPGGALVAQCGGPGNVASVLAAAAALGRTTDAVNFATPEETARRLRAAGFVDVWTWITHEPASFASTADLEAFLAAVALRTHLDGLGPAARAAFVHAVAARLPSPEIDYVRLNILARRAPAGD
ncbi:MAG: class I SAM-dependent methyltransferase [Acidimicrobiales bacterium]